MNKITAKQIRIGLKGGGKTGQEISGNNITLSSRQIPADRRGKGNSLFLFKRNPPYKMTNIFCELKKHFYF